MKPFLSLNYPDTAFDCAQIECDYSMAHSSYPYEDPLFAGSFVAYGPQGINQPQMLPQMLGLQSTRVALPLDLAEEGPVYVNAKQYHGILRRRQSRAKLEAQNKLIKNRKPYLHESRHRHALNRVRGSGGRFLSTKQFEQSNADVATGAHSSSDPSKDASKVESHLLRTAGNASSITTCSDRTSLSSNSVSRQPEAQLFLAGPANMGRAPVVW
ncbi:nuclear transcription factor Y subunit A-7-like [Arachis stenosperma]|uniref:nuclear transcription factor Y subunit A-7-like n=1 Tax=Arachis stenosperma TaxID=217475 RepID=UPI0025AD40E7|nr:nuclear transcription factor Y subunit A-7-like [Arachis stenosperma]XP_057751233.1 nuclear transcription factor Y subunit A-7-like [Arachis stenosperma]XP_057751234.1 nuclear transcription factor Y subunit A-7-like [Arachis stenosperma]